jgi:2'-5' RNA ligase
MKSELQALYDAFWENASEHFRHKGVQTDLHLLNKEEDTRRGLTLIARPGLFVREQVAKFLDEMKIVLPGQYCYVAEALHLTVLSLISASAHFHVNEELLAGYCKVVESVLKDTHPLAIRFHGITASPGGVLIQGFPEADALNHLRNRLRTALGEVGLDGALDVRYRITTAHMTAIRFMCQPDDPQTLIDVLGAYRQRGFGEMRVDTLHLVTNDWYMSPERVKLLRTYTLA